MRKVTGAAFLSLDGVMQAPGGRNEDPTGGFEHGGWLANSFDEAAGETIDALFREPFDLLLGRRTYDIFAGYWPYADGESKPMGELFGRIGKYVLTRSDKPLHWQNSHRLESIEAIAALKKDDGPDLVIQGSSTLYPQLLAAGLIDRLVLMTFPVVLGQGKRLFGEGTPSGAMRMVDHKVSPRGNIIATYERAGELRTADIAFQEPSEAEVARQAAMKEGTW